MCIRDRGLSVKSATVVLSLHTMPPLVTIKPLSKETGLPVRTLRTLIQRRKIPFIKCGHRTMYFDPGKVRAALDCLEVKATLPNCRDLEPFERGHNLR